MLTKSILLDTGSDLRESIQELANSSKSNGYIIGVVGNLSKAVFQCPTRKVPTILLGNLEIITLNGTFNPDNVHLHLSISDSDCKVWGGHLEPGTVVDKSASIFLGFLEKDQTTSIYIPPTTISKDSSLEIFVLNNCPWSSRVIRIVRSYKIPHKLVIIETTEQFDRISSKSHTNTFPQVFYKGQFLGGYQEFNKLHLSGKLNSLN